MEKINVVFVGRSGAIGSGNIDNLRAYSALEIQFVDTLFEAEEIVSQNKRVAFVIGPRVPFHDAAAFASRLSRSREDVVCILEVASISPDVLREALRAGFRDVVQEGTTEIEPAIGRAHEIITHSATKALSANGDDMSKYSGRVLSFLSPKGGVGKTVLATNTAIGIATQFQKRVILLDLNRQFGDVGVFLGLPPDIDATDFAYALDRLDQQMLSSLLTRHSSGIDVLLASAKMDFSRHMTEVQLANLISVACTLADYVIIDTPPSMQDNSRHIPMLSDAVFLVTTLEVPSVKNTRFMLQVLQSMGYPDWRTKVILNRSNSDVSLSPAEVVKHLKVDIAAQVPSDASIPRSVNEGIPILQDYSERVTNKLMSKQRKKVAEAMMGVVRIAADVQPLEGKDTLNLNGVTNVTS